MKKQLINASLLSISSSINLLTDNNFSHEILASSDFRNLILNIFNVLWNASIKIESNRIDADYFNDFRQVDT